MKVTLPIAAALAVTFSPVVAQVSPPEETGPYCEQGLSDFATPALLTRDWHQPVGLLATVQEVTLMRHPGEARPSVRLLVTTEEGLVEIHVAPRWFLLANHIEIEPGDVVDVTGRVLEVGGEEVFAAITLAVDEEVHLLRTVEGKPLWAEEQAPAITDPI